MRPRGGSQDRGSRSAAFTLSKSVGGQTFRQSLRMSGPNDFLSAYRLVKAREHPAADYERL